jgi:hypothetical protein
MSRKNLKADRLTYDGQVFARRRSRVRKVPAKTCNNDASAAFAEQGRTDRKPSAVRTRATLTRLHGIRLTGQLGRHRYDN